MKFRALKYLLPLILFAGSVHSFHTTGIQVWFPLLFAWVFIPLLELLLHSDARNMNAAEEEIARADNTYDLVLYIIVPLQYVALYFFLNNITDPSLSTIDIIGRIMAMGLLCGVFGINVGHELGHRTNKFEQTLAKLLLLTSLYTHFFIEHNKGHHKRVATPEDPSSARYGEWVYAFYLRSVIKSYFSAWHIANKEVIKKRHAVLSLKNEMIRLQLLQLAFVLVIFFVYRWQTTLYFIAAATIGFLLLETVNYIEHYGLRRKTLPDGKYERALPVHSWNSNHVAGRLLLFELSRHSDHHYMASRKYQVLRHHDDSPQMPTGYPGMMILSLIPPLWFSIMNKRVKKYMTS